MPKQEKKPSRVRVRMARVWSTAGQTYKPGDVVEVSPQAAESLLNDRAATPVDPVPPIEKATSGPDATPKGGAAAASRADTVGPTTADGKPTEDASGAAAGSQAGESKASDRADKSSK